MTDSGHDIATPEAGAQLPPAVDDGGRRRRLPRSLPATAAVAGLAALVGVAVAAAIGDPVRHVPWSSAVVAEAGPGSAPKAIRRLERLVPGGRIVVIDSARGRLRVLRDGVEERAAACSAGSGTILIEPGDRVWVFDTPLGERRVIEKRRNPVWTKPDWAFVEEGTLPPKRWAERRDDVSLGDYALSLGDGYLIHGTLFQSLLGQPVTHGCIRLGDEDLEYVWRTVGVGTRVYLY